MANHLAPIFLVEMRQDFSVRGAAKRVTALFQIGAQLAVVVDLAIKDNGDALVFVESGLFTGEEVDNRQAPHAQRDTIIDKITFRIGTAMDHAVAH